MKKNKKFCMAISMLVLPLYHSYANGCIYRLSETPQKFVQEIDVFLGGSSDGVDIKSLNSISSITVQKKPFRVILFDAPNDMLTITSSNNEYHKINFNKLLKIKDVCAGDSVSILNEFIGGVKGYVNVYIDINAKSFHFWGNDRYVDAISFTSYYKVQDDIFVISRTTKNNITKIPD